MLLPTVLGLGSERAAALLQAMTDLHDHHERDAWESIFTAYQAGTYSKVCCLFTMYNSPSIAPEAR